MERGQSYHPEALNGNGNGNGKGLQRLPLAYPAEREETEQDSFNPRELIAIARRRGLVIVAVALSVTVAIAFTTSKEKPVYESNFQLQIEPTTSDQSQLAQLAQGAASASGIGKSGMDYETLIEVLRSPQFLAPITQQIQTQYPTLSYNSLMRGLSLNKVGETKILNVSYRGTNPEEIEFVLNKLANAYIEYSQRERQSNVRQGIRFVEEQLPKLQDRVDELQKQMQAFRERYQLVDPDTKANDLLTRLAAMDEQRVQNIVSLNETRTLYLSLQQQIGYTPDQALAVSALSEAPRYQALLDQLKNVETKIATESTRLTAEHPTIQSLLEERQNLLPLLNQEATAVLGDSNVRPDGQSTSPSSVRAALTQQLVDAANQLQVIQVRQAAISQAQQGLQAQLQQMPLLARQYTDLMRQLTVATESLSRFLAAQRDLEIQAAQQGYTWQLLLAPKRPNIPISATLQRSILIGAVAGLLLGMAVALLLEKLDNVFHSLDELKQKIKLPLLGTIPLTKNLKSMAEIAEIAAVAPVTSRHSQPRQSRKASGYYNASAFSEALRSLYTNISFLASDNPIRSFVISSATPGDGKSTISTNLAQAAAAMGQRVLLVDVDMRRPQVHNVLGIENELGLSNLLATDIAPEEAIIPTPIDNFYVLTAGNPLPIDPVRPLSSKKMQDLMTHFQSQFDLIIYDTPPVLGFADGRLLIPHTAGIILVVRIGKTDKSAVMETLDLLKVSSASMLGIVANGVRNNQSASYYSYKSYRTDKGSNSQDSEVEKGAKILQKSIRKKNSY